MGRATNGTGRQGSPPYISIRALRGEGDSNLKEGSNLWQNFYPRPPWGGRHTDLRPGQTSRRYFYPRPPWGGRPQKQLPGAGDRRISIHALRGEGDCNTQGSADRRGIISIHALRGEGDQIVKSNVTILRNFYPRPPWGGRRRRGSCPLRLRHFYPRPPWGGRQQKYTKIRCIFCAKGTIISPPGGAIRCAAAKRQPQHSTTWQQNVETLGAKHPGRCWSPGIRTGVTAAKHRPAQTRGAAQRVQRGFCNGCPAGKTAGCRRRGQSVPSAAP